MLSPDKVVLSCAVTGSIHTPSMSPHLPITPEEIANEAIAAAEAGASIVHIHVRDPETGKPSSDQALFRQVAERIQDGCDAIVQPTTGGGLGMDHEERVEVVKRLSPEMASFNLGSMNYGLHPIADRFEFEYDWEEEYLNFTRRFVYDNSFEFLETILPLFADHNTMPELECYDIGHLYIAEYLVEQGLLELPIHIQFVMGILGGIQAKPKHLTHLVTTAEELFGDQYSFSVIGAGRHEFPLGMQAVNMGGNLRVGLEDNLYLRQGELAESNADLVAKAVELLHELNGLEPASPDETRAFLGLKGADQVSF